MFESAGRFTGAVTGTGAVSYTIAGANITTGATAAGALNHTLVVSSYGYIQTRSPFFAVTIEITKLGSDMKSFHGIGPSILFVSGTDINFTKNHAGFKLVRASSGDCSLYATQADGSTETASSALTTVVQGDILELMMKINGTESVDYYWSKNNGAISSATNLTTHKISNGEVLVNGITNMNVDSTSTISLKSMSYER